MKIALVHDYIKEYGGAERVLKTLSEIYPDSPIYTAFCVKNSTAGKEFAGKEIHESWLAPLLKIDKFYSPLRFLTPLVWGTMDLSEYDLVITSCSWYITRGFKIGSKTKVIAYCHTPPRWLYGYEMSVGFTKYWPIRVYSLIVGHFMRMYDFKTAQPPSQKATTSRRGVDYFIANSENVKARIKKFYRRESVVIYPPVDIEKIARVTNGQRPKTRDQEYFLIVSRLVGAKGIENAVNAFSKSKSKNIKLKIVGEAHGFSDVENRISNMVYRNIELLGRVSDERLYELYSGAKGFIALARDEDFGITPVEAMAAGTPVIAFNGGGFKETVVDGVTGLLINNTDEKTINDTIKKFDKIKWDKEKLQNQARKFSQERFKKEIVGFIDKYV